MFPDHLLSQGDFKIACLHRARASAASEIYARHHFVEGVTPPVIAARYGVSRQAVGKALKRFEMAIERMHKAVANGASSTQ